MHPRVSRLVVSVALASVIATGGALAALSLSTSIPITEAFDGIGTTATATLPTDFKVDRPTTVRTVGSFAAALTATTQAGGANLSTTATNGVYNFGAGTTATGPDRAVGFLSSGTATQSGNLYVQLSNTTGNPLSGLQIFYAVEKYRSGSNAAGFRIQLFQSFDGTSWTSAGSAFLTSFAADANNNGFATAPGATVSVNAPLNVPIPAGASFYLAWNYSVATGSTTTNAQALAIDDISIVAIAAGDVAPTVQNTTPVNSATNVPVGSNIVINFSEPVNATTSSFSLQCPSGSAETPFTLSASPASSFTLDPTVDLPYGTVCTLTVNATQITDIDDAPDNMAADYTLSFTTVVADAAPAVTTTTPANGAANVAVDSNIAINFSESVTASDSAFSIQCPAGSPQAFTQTGSPAASFTLDPIAPLPANTTCTVTVVRAAGEREPKKPSRRPMRSTAQVSTLKRFRPTARR